MIFNVTVLGRDSASEHGFARQLRTALENVAEAKIELGSEGKPHGQVVFVDGAAPNANAWLDRIDRKGRAVFLILPELHTGTPQALLDGRVDDVLVAPFRPLEVLSKLRHYQQILMWDEVNQLNASFQDVIGRFQEDLKFAERLQKSKLPIRFPEVRGFKITNRYLAGMRSGGDHFDLAESREGHQLSLVLSDSSSYGLSSSVLNVLMRVAMKLSVDEVRSSRDTVKRIYEELVLTLNEKDKLSLFYGTVSRKDYKLRYVNFGTSRVFYAPPKDQFIELPTHGGQITQTSGMPGDGDGEISLVPEGRLALMSDGFIETVGGPAAMVEFLNRYRDKESVDALNEMVFAVKSKFTEPDDLPEQDCTGIIFDVDARVMRVL